MITSSDFKRVNNDINGNPRYVIHFMHLLSQADTKEFPNGMHYVSNCYEAAVAKARRFGGKKYRGKDFGGGIVFQSYNLNTLCNDINFWTN